MKSIRRASTNGSLSRYALEKASASLENSPMRKIGDEEGTVNNK